MDIKRGLSILLPATDETYSLKETIVRIKKDISDRDLEFIIVTHPTFTTPECRATIAELLALFPLQVRAFDQERPGIGGALRDAIERIEKEATVLMASDLETDPAVLPAMLHMFDQGYDIVATSRWRGGARFSGYNPMKFVLNGGFQILFRALYWAQLTDLTYAYRVYRSDILKKIRWEETRFPFLFETIVKPLRLGYRVGEVAAPWRARTEGKSHNSLRQTLDYVRVGIRIRFLPRSRIVLSNVDA